MTSAAKREAIERLTRLSASQQRALVAVATGSSHAEAADAAGVTRETVTRWLGNHQGFRSALNSLRWSLAQQQQTQASLLVSESLQLLLAYIGDDDQPVRERVSAALGVLRSVSPVEVARPTDPLLDLATDYEAMFSARQRLRLDRLASVCADDTLAAMETLGASQETGSDR